MQSLRALLRQWTAHVPPKQLLRYVMVGIWNTVFGYATFALLTYLLDGFVPYSYLPASLAASILNITVSFLGYKWFVFKTRGNYWREWWRSLVVYSGSIVVGLILLPPFVFVTAKLTGHQASAPYLAGAILMAIQVIISFIGHRRFTFARGEGDRPDQ